MAFQLSANSWVDDNGVVHDGVLANSSIGKSVSNPVVQTPSKVTPVYVANPISGPLQTYQQIATYGYQTDPDLVKAEQANPIATATPAGNITSQPNVYDLYTATGKGIPVSVLNNNTVPSSNSNNSNNSSYDSSSIPIWTVTPLTSNNSVIPANTVVNSSTGNSFINAITEAPLLDLTVIGLVLWMVFRK